MLKALFQETSPGSAQYRGVKERQMAHTHHVKRNYVKQTLGPLLQTVEWRISTGNACKPTHSVYVIHVPRKKRNFNFPLLPS